MPRLVNIFPKYRHHKATGQAVVNLNGHDIYLGLYKSQASRLEYDRVITQWMAAGRRHVPIQAQSELSILALCLAYLEFAEGYYVKNGKPTSQLINVKLAIRYLREHYGRTLAVDFGPLALQTMQRILAEKRLTRKTVNSLVGIYKAMFRWANNQEMLPPHVYQALQPVPGLKMGRSLARESQPVRPVDPQIVEQTLPYLPTVVADMVRFQLLTAVRPQEVYNLRPCDIDRTETIWRYTPEHHKTEHHGKSRTIHIGPQAQAVLAAYLERDPEECCFQPRESETQRNAERKSKRATPMTPSHRRRVGKSNRKRSPRKNYGVDTYRRAIARACDAIDKRMKNEQNQQLLKQGQPAQFKFEKGEPRLFPNWHPNQLRHTQATLIRAKYGVEMAQLMLGHSNVRVTEIDAEKDQAAAARIAAEIG